MFANQSKQGSNQGQQSLRLPCAGQSSLIHYHILYPSSLITYLLSQGPTILSRIKCEFVSWFVCLFVCDLKGLHYERLSDIYYLKVSTGGSLLLVPKVLVNNFYSN